MGLQTFLEFSDEELDRIERRCDAATEGPWFSERDEVACCIELGECNELGTCRTIELSGATVADQDFIANARQDLSRLLHEVRILRARLQAMNSDHAHSGRAAPISSTRAVVAT